MTTDTVAALCCALDACPESEVGELLGILADALEEAQDERAAQLRARFRPAGYPDGTFGWVRIKAAGERMDARYHHMCGDEIPTLVWDALPKAKRANRFVKFYPTRSAAFLALALALALTKS